MHKGDRLTGRVGSIWDSAASLLMGLGSFWRWRWRAHVSRCPDLFRNRFEMIVGMRANIPVLPSRVYSQWSAHPLLTA